jgi:hypothetical protein
MPLMFDFFADTGTSRPDNTDALSPTAAAASSARPQSVAATRRMSQANAPAKPAMFDAQSELMQCQKLEAQSQMWHVSGLGLATLIPPAYRSTD